MEKLLAIFCDVDDFCKSYEDYCEKHLLMDKKQIVPQTSVYLSEIMTIVIYFHLSLSDKFLIRKRAVIKSVNDFLKNICQIYNQFRTNQSYDT